MFLILLISMDKDFSLVNKKVWVAGHSGLVGNALCKRLETEKCRVLKVSRKKLDLTDESSVSNWINTNLPQIVFISAARVGGILANSNYPAEFITENIQIQTNIIKHAHKSGVEKLIFLGSACVYPISEEPIKENMLMKGKLEETNIAYAIAKIAGIEMCKSYFKQYKSSFISVQPNNLYGENDNFSKNDSHVIPGLIRRLHQAKKKKLPQVVIWGSGEPLREFLHADDCADALLLILKRYNQIDPINIGSGEEISINKLAHLIAKIVGFKGKLIFDRKFPDGVMRKFLDNSKLNELGWKPNIRLEDGINVTYDWFKKNIINE